MDWEIMLFISVNRFMIAITLWRAEDKVMYSALVVLSAISVCNLEPQTIGQLAYVMIYSVWEGEDIG